MPTEQSTFWFRVAAGSSSLLCGAFLIWAGIVWNAAQDLRKIAGIIAVDVAVIKSEMGAMQSRSQYHEQLPWHEAAGKLHQESMSKIDRIEQQMLDE